MALAIDPGSVNVTVGYTFNPLTSLVMKDSFNMSSTGQMVIAH